MRRTPRSGVVRWDLEFVTCQLTLLILALILLWPVVVRPSWWLWKPGSPHSDLAVAHWPNAHFTRRALWEHGRFPLWRPTIMSGTPFAANPLAGLYYPLNWLLLFLPWLPLEVGFNLSALVHLWLAGAAMYALMRRGLGTGVWGALVAAVVYEAAPKLVAHLGAGHVGWAQAWAWLPLVVLCWVQVCKWASMPVGKWASMQVAKSARLQVCKWAVGGGVILAMQFCADVRMAAYTLVAGCLLLIAWMLDARTLVPHSPFATRHSPFAIRHLPFLICSFVVFAGLTACQWFPLVALLPETTRASMTLHDAAVRSLPWSYFAGLLLADHGGFHEWMTYVGMGTLVLAGIGARVLWRERGERWPGNWLVSWLVVLLVGAAWFSLGENGGLFQVLWRVVPGLGLLRVPPRAWVLVVFTMAVLAGLGMDSMGGQRDQRTRRTGRWWRMAMLAVGAFPPLFVAGYWLLVEMPPVNMAMFGVVTPLVVALIGFRSQISGTRIGANLKPGTRKLETALGCAAVLLVAIDLLVVDVTLVEARSPEEVFTDGQAAAGWLATQPGRFRVYSPSYSIPQHVAELYGLELADGVDPLQLMSYAGYLTRAAGLEPHGYGVTLPPFPEEADVRTVLKDTVPDTEMLGLLGVRYVAAAFPVADDELQLVGLFEGVYLYRNERAQPMVDAGLGDEIVLADGTVLFRYRPWAVYAGWAMSGVMVGVLLACWLRGRWADD
ncbi:MAG: hypothetical protein SWK90_07525 [Chloroflexota bacterium]|nr:hypothetical protein [Chloroflexota bacterium]